MRMPGRGPRHGTALAATVALFVGAAALAAASVAPPTAVEPRRFLDTVRLDGIERHDNSGFAASDAGDVDGDGVDDILVGAFAAAADGEAFSGETYLVFGSALRDAARPSAAGTVGLAALAPRQGLRLAGGRPQIRSGVSVASAGDVDQDGLGDVLVGAHFAERDGEPLAGRTFLVFGATLKAAAAGQRHTIALDEIARHEGVTLLGPPGGNRAGWSVSDAGDVDGDGAADIVIGTHVAAGTPGKAFVVFGATLAAAARGTGMVDLATLAAGEGVVLNGAEADDFAGLEVSGAGDVDGDGLSDVLVGAFGTRRDGQHRVGAAHLVTGAALVEASRRPRPVLDLAAMAPREGLIVAGVAAGDNNGRSVAAAGDVDGDGLDDIIVGAWSAQPDGKHWCGETYLLFGRGLSRRLAGDGGGTVDLRALSGSEGIVFRGAAADDFAGWSVGSAGDVDGDGLDDVLVGAYGVDPAGAAYVLFGSAVSARAGSSARPAIELAELAGPDGVRIDGAVQGSNTGFRVSGAGDVDGDGLDDVLVGAPNADLPGGREAAGQTFVVSGAAIVEAAEDGGVLRLLDESGGRHTVRGTAPDEDRHRVAGID